jgi:hypothetical protein
VGNTHDKRHWNVQCSSMFIVLILVNMFQPLFDLYNSEWCFPAQGLKDDPEVPCRPLGFGSCWTPSLHRSAWRLQRRKCPHLGKDQGVSTRAFLQNQR